MASSTARPARWLRPRASCAPARARSSAGGGFEIDWPRDENDAGAPVERRLGGPAVLPELYGARFLGGGLHQGHVGRGVFGVGLFLLQLEVGVVQRRQHCAGLHALPNFDEALHDFAGDSKAEVGFNARPDRSDKFPGLRLWGEVNLGDEHGTGGGAILSPIGFAVAGGKRQSRRRQQRGQDQFKGQSHGAVARDQHSPFCHD